MKIKFTEAKWSIDERGTWLNVLVPPQSRELAIKTVEELDGEQVLDIKKFRQKRSLDSNAYLWLLVNEMANVLRSSKEEVYLQMLKRYGQSSVVSVVEEATETFEKSVKYSERFGESNLNGKNFIHIKVYMGSSEFNSLQMSIFLDGIISEAESLKIPTITPAEVQRLKDNWKGEL